ncbi:MAG: aldo/keto reductase [Chlorobi bacterium]|nr:aldo/keto reductase [Chlorobiota bacterium]
MTTRQLGTSDLHPSVISFGTWGIGGPPHWSPVDEKTAVSTLKRAYDLGVTCFDTAPVYGLGHAETLVGKALKDVRHRVIYATKLGLRWKEPENNIYRDCSGESIRFEIEQSLRRLRTDYIDLYQVHWPDRNVSLEETFTTLRALQDEGKIRYIGVSNYSVDLIREARQYADIVSVQPRYNLLDRAIEKDLLPYCRKERLGVLPYSPLASGLLTGKYTRESTFSDWRGQFGDFFKPDVYERYIIMVENLQCLAEEIGTTLTTLSIAWVIAREGVTSAIVGANTVEHLESNVAAADLRLDGEIMDRIDTILNER